jgi:hypothetical protein
MRWLWHCRGAVLVIVILAVAGAAFSQPQAASASGSTAPSPSKTTSTAKTNSTGKKKNATSSAGRSSSSKHRKRTTASSQSNPRKVVVRKGGAVAPPAQIASGMDPTEAARDRQDADKSLNYADSQLKALANRTLNPQQQETVGQAHNYIAGARVALKEGDVQRANTLALKARLLADDLIRH